jgi:hypothetical protein
MRYQYIEWDEHNLWKNEIKHGVTAEEIEQAILKSSGPSREDIWGPASLCGFSGQIRRYGPANSRKGYEKQ